MNNRVLLPPFNPFWHLILHVVVTLSNQHPRANIAPLYNLSSWHSFTLAEEREANLVGSDAVGYNHKRDRGVAQPG